MLKITNITEAREVNYNVSNKTFQKLINDKNVRNYSEYSKSVVTLMNHIREEFEEEVKIGTFNDINDYIEYFIERCREI